MHRYIFLKNYKHIFLLIITITSLVSNANPKNTIFLWDIHDVIITRNKQKIEEIIKKLPHKEKINSHLVADPHLHFASFWDMNGDNLIFDLVDHAYKNKIHLPEFIIYLSEFYIALGNAHEPIEGTWKIIKELHAQGYQHHIASNIIEPVYYNLIDSQKNPDLAYIFTFFDLSKSQIVYHRHIEPTFLRKPSPAFFAEYLHKNNIDLHHTQVIFIDDNKDNVRVAKSMGFTALLFTTPDQLRSDLQKLGIY